MHSLRSPMPKGIGYIYAINILVVFIYAVLFSSLMIFLTKTLSFSTGHAENVVGLFLALNFILHLFAGFIGGRLISNRYLLVISTIIKVIGIYILSTESVENVFWGLSLVVIGCGINTTCLQCILTQQFDKNDSRRESAFFWMYSALNAGFFLGFTMSGYFDLVGHYKYLYLLGVVVTIMAIFCIYFAWPYINERGTVVALANKKNRSKMCFLGTALVLVLIPFVTSGFHYPSLANDLIFGLGITTLLSVLLFIVKCKNKKHKSGMLAFLILTFFSIIFWSLFYVGPLGGILFLENNVDLFVLGFKLAPQWLMNLNSIFIIVGSPCLGMIFNRLRNKGCKITIPRQFSLALILIALSYFIFSIGIYYSDNRGKTALIWVVLHYIFQAAGELFIAPVGYAMIGQLIPDKLQGFMMGTWMMVSGIAVELSNWFSHLMTRSGSLDPILNNDNYSQTFNMLGISTIIFAVILMLFVPFLDKLVMTVSEET